LVDFCAFDPLENQFTRRSIERKQKVPAAVVRFGAAQERQYETFDCASGQMAGTRAAKNYGICLGDHCRRCLQVVVVVVGIVLELVDHHNFATQSTIGTAIVTRTASILAAAAAVASNQKATHQSSTAISRRTRTNTLATGPTVRCSRDIVGQFNDAAGKLQ
jgi:hypothetical protein